MPSKPKTSKPNPPLIPARSEPKFQRGDFITIVRNGISSELACALWTDGDHRCRFHIHYFVGSKEDILANVQKVIEIEEKDARDKAKTDKPNPSTIPARSVPNKELELERDSLRARLLYLEESNEHLRTGIKNIGVRNENQGRALESLTKEYNETNQSIEEYRSINETITIHLTANEARVRELEKFADTANALALAALRDGGCDIGDLSNLESACERICELAGEVMP